MLHKNLPADQISLTLIFTHLSSVGDLSRRKNKSFDIGLDVQVSKCEVYTSVYNDIENENINISEDVRT